MGGVGNFILLGMLLTTGELLILAMTVGLEGVTGRLLGDIWAKTQGVETLLPDKEEEILVRGCAEGYYKFANHYGLMLWPAANSIPELKVPYISYYYSKIYQGIKY